MTLIELLAIIEKGDKVKTEESVKLFSSSHDSKVNDLSEQMGVFEGVANEEKRKTSDAINSRDKAKAQLKIVKSSLSLPGDAITDNTISDAITRIKGSSDDDKDKEITKLREDNQALTVTIDGKNEEITISKENHEKQIQGYAVDAKLSMYHSDINAVTPDAHNIITFRLKEGAEIDGESVIYKDNQGVTERADGQPMSPRNKIELMRNDSATSYLFKTSASGGSGSSNEGGEGLNKWQSRIAKIPSIK